jgi:hypothetical protein
MMRKTKTLFKATGGNPLADGLTKYDKDFILK